MPNIHILSLKTRQGHPWAPASPDMNTSDLWLLGDLKEKVYKPLPQSMEELRNRISFHFNNLAFQTISTAVMSLRKRVSLMVQNNGKAFDGAEKRIRI